MKIKERYDEVFGRLSEAIPDPKTELDYDTPFHLLLAVILSAQCTDKRVNMVTPALFEAYPTPEVLAAAQPEAVYEYIKSVSYPNNKSKLLVGAAKTLVERFGGEMPRDIDSLMELPGVGRKTANVMLAVVWEKAAMPVDTHVFRVSERIGLTTNSKTPYQTEMQLVKHLPGENLPRAHHQLILHGRYVCKARKPDCVNCCLKEVCRDFQKRAKKADKKMNKKMGAGDVG